MNPLTELMPTGALAGNPVSSSGGSSPRLEVGHRRVEPRNERRTGSLRCRAEPKSRLGSGSFFRHGSWPRHRTLRSVVVAERSYRRGGGESGTESESSALGSNAADNATARAGTIVDTDGASTAAGPISDAAIAAIGSDDGRHEQE
jgi:hypothetical protein